MIDVTCTSICKNFHTPLRFCKNGGRCKYIHAYQYEGEAVPEDTLSWIINENRRRNFINGIAKCYPKVATKFETYGTG